ncbi:MAG: protein translocase subunit SecF [Bryobacteraceae bacterium]|nr:protein translocase subunit SecF [Bryobacteraceae bacterium]
MELFKGSNFDFLGKKTPFIVASLILTAVGLGSLIVKGGPEYGIDFKGGAMMNVRFAEKPQVDKVRAAVSARIPGEISVQEVTSGDNEVIIGTELREDKELESVRATLVDTLDTTFGQPQSGKLDFNNASQAALAERMRGPLQRAGVPLSEIQLQDLSRAIMEYRNTPPRSGLIRNHDELAAVPGVTKAVVDALKQETYLAPFSIRNVEVVGPKVGGELRSKAIQATLLALAGMLVYIGFRFEFAYGFAAVIAVFHDTVITIGLFSLFNKPIDLTVVAALLTLVGYSMNDTIVVFDRIRENLRLTRKDGFYNIVNASINQTLSRTILTSGLTFLTAVALWLFGGPVLNGFAFALVVGILVGTYSSIFIASPILVFWQNFTETRKKGAVAPAVSGAPRKAVK